MTTQNRTTTKLTCNGSNKFRWSLIPDHRPVLRWKALGLLVPKHSHYITEICPKPITGTVISRETWINQPYNLHELLPLSRNFFRVHYLKHQANSQKLLQLVQNPEALQKSAINFSRRNNSNTTLKTRVLSEGQPQGSSILTLKPD